MFVGVSKEDYAEVKLTKEASLALSPEFFDYKNTIFLFDPIFQISTFLLFSVMVKVDV